MSTLTDITKRQFTIKDALKQFDGLEWYDNHKINLILTCKRKAFYNDIGPLGIPLAMRVGAGAKFGTCAHASVAQYHALYGHDEEERIIASIRRFDKTWRKEFDGYETDNAHSLQRGWDIMDAYYLHFRDEASYYKPFDIEIGAAILVRPYAGETKFDPFVYMGRLDGINERIHVGDFVIRETKTVGSGVERRLRKLRFDRQTRGYAWIGRKIMPSNPPTGVLADVILVAAQKYEFGRDYFPVTEGACESWRRQTINEVEGWRRLRRESGVSNMLQLASTSGKQEISPATVDLDRFTQATERCLEYGECPFYNLCYYGPVSPMLQDYTANTWHPLMGDEEQTEKPVIVVNE